MSTVSLESEVQSTEGNVPGVEGWFKSTLCPLKIHVPIVLNNLLDQGNFWYLDEILIAHRIRISEPGNSAG
jgi:hypothetical protein